MRPGAQEPTIWLMSGVPGCCIDLKILSGRHRALCLMIQSLLLSLSPCTPSSGRRRGEVWKFFKPLLKHFLHSPDSGSFLHRTHRTRSWSRCTLYMPLRSAAAMAVCLHDDGASSRSSVVPESPDSILRMVGASVQPPANPTAGTAPLVSDANTWADEAGYLLGRLKAQLRRFLKALDLDIAAPSTAAATPGAIPEASPVDAHDLLRVLAALQDLLSQHPKVQTRKGG